MTNHEVLTVYAAMGELTGQMVDAAAGADWDRLEALEQRVSEQRRLLQAGEGAVQLDGTERERKVSLIRKILDDDRKIRDLTMPWMAQLSRLINSAGAERRLANAYGGV